MDVVVCVFFLLFRIFIHVESSTASKIKNIDLQKCVRRRYGVKCAGCCHVIGPRDLVRRAPAGDVIYHVACFSCVACGRRLSTGDPLGVLPPDGRRFVCRDDWARHTAPPDSAAAAADRQADGMITELLHKLNTTELNYCSVHHTHTHTHTRLTAVCPGLPG